MTTNKKRSVMDRAFTAARYWIAKKGYLGHVEDREDHIAYRSGWAAGYAAARRDSQTNGSGESHG